MSPDTRIHQGCPIGFLTTKNSLKPSQSLYYNGFYTTPGQINQFFRHWKQLASIFLHVALLNEPRRSLRPRSRHARRVATRARAPVVTRVR